MLIVRTIGGILALIGVILAFAGLFVPLSFGIANIILFSLIGGVLLIIGMIVLMIGAIAHF